MTFSRAGGIGTGSSASTLALLRRATGNWLAGRLSRWTSRLRAAEEVSFEAHVDQALSIARQLPPLRVVPAAPAATTSQRTGRP